jgi:hypothetical protein
MLIFMNKCCSNDRKLFSILRSVQDSVNRLALLVPTTTTRTSQSSKRKTATTKEQAIEAFYCTNTGKALLISVLNE